MAKSRDTTKYPVRRFKSLAVALKELEPFIRDGQHLQSGKPFKQLGDMRSREAVANWLICAAANFQHDRDRMSFTSDPTGGDGVIYDAETKATWKTEHVMVRRPITPEEKANRKPVEAQILEAIARKQAKGGAAYASGKELIVFLDADGGEWWPNRVASELHDPLLFDHVWVVGLHGSVVDEYVYAVSVMEPATGTAPTWLVRIATDFQGWTIERRQ